MTPNKTKTEITLWNQFLNDERNISDQSQPTTPTPAPSLDLTGMTAEQRSKLVYQTLAAFSAPHDEDATD